MKALKRIVLGSLLFLTLVLVGACDLRDIEGSFTVQIITAGDNPLTQVVETEYVSNELVIEFAEEDELLELLRDNFTVYCGGEDGEKDELCLYDSGYGRYLLAIDTLDATTVENGYISFYINGSYAVTGVDSTPLKDGDVYSFKIETY